MPIRVDLQIACRDVDIPAAAEIKAWIRTTLKQFRNNAEMTVRIVETTEAAELNQRWRNAKGPTNVLSFPAGDAAAVVPDLLGDIVICATVVEKEAVQQKKKPKAHWAHMVVHGTLHLLGFDHMKKHEAEKMEAMEISILEKLGFENPYL